MTLISSGCADFGSTSYGSRAGHVLPPEWKRAVKYGLKKIQSTSRNLNIIQSILIFEPI